MKAYDYSMALIFINAGFAIIFSLDIFGAVFGNHASSWNALSVIANYEFTIPGTELAFPGITAIAIAIAVASASFVGTRVSSPSGVATTWFAFLFWGSFTISFITLSTIPLPGMEIWLTIFSLAAVLLFAITLIQMQTGGQKANV
jgi:hypothetical protein